MAIVRVKPPIWFWIVAILLALWEAIGAWGCVEQIRLGAEAWPAADAYDRTLYTSLPAWYNPVYGVATFGGLIAALLLLMRSRLAVVFFTVSLIAVIVMFGYVLAATDLIAHKGAGTAVTLPLIIFVLALFAVWVSLVSRQRRWIA